MSLPPASCYFVVHSIGAKDDSSAPGSRVEVVSSVGGSAASFGVSSTVKGGAASSSGSSGAHTGTGRIDLLCTFGGFVCATFSDSARLVIYSLAAQSKQGQSTLPERARAMLVEPLQRFLLLGSASGRLRVYALASGSQVADVRTPHDRGINALAVDAQARWLVVGGEDGVVSVYDFAALVQGAVARFGSAAAAASSSAAAAYASALLMSISDHSLAITALHISTSNMLLTTGKDGSVRLYQLEQPVHTAAGGDGAAGSSSSQQQQAPAPPCLFHHAFRGIVSSAVMDDTETIVYVACKENIHWLPIYAPAAPASAAFASASSSSSSSSSAAAAANRAPVALWRGHSAPILSLVLTPGSGQLLSLDAEGHAKLWEGRAPGAACPPLQGVCVKNMPRRNGCKNVAWVDARDWVGGAGKGNTVNASGVATLNTHALQTASARSGGGALHLPKESSWLFPPLNNHPPSIVSFVPLTLTAFGAINHEQRGGLARSSAATLRRVRRPFSALQEQAAREVAEEGFGAEDSDDEGEEGSGERRAKYLRSDCGIAAGKGGWSVLAERAASSGNTLELLQGQLESNTQSMHELYAACVDKVWKELKSSSAK